MANAPQMIYLKDYRVPDFLAEEVELDFDLNEGITTVKARLRLRRNPKSDQRDAPLVLHGEQMRLIDLLLDDVPLMDDRYSVDDQALIIHGIPDGDEPFWVATEVEINPASNKSLNGLYTSSGNYATQCEPHGFRRITYFLDRPDVLCRFKTRITADAELYPVLLANGNLIDKGEAPAGRHWVLWEDPSLKPCYLFALVAGDFEHVEDTFTTCGGREVKLQVFVEPGKKDKAGFSIESLKRAMAWDEKVYGREYDLDIYMIVAVSDFNFGAMENKGLNIFNDKYILANGKTATDADFIAVDAVIAHEYFHNWSGNRVTLRDWFQLSLKEGFTVFRDQSFTADHVSPVVKRIQDVRILRSAQFNEDAGPMAHSVRPEAYMEVSNFYTVTVYNKGAEVIRMMHTLLGPKLFRKGSDLYFERHDGQAVTTEDFAQAMQDASGMDLTQFKRWYSQAGTPTLAVRSQYDAKAKELTLSVSQSCPATPGQPDKAPFFIPFVVGLLGEDGKDMKVAVDGSNAQTEHVLHVTQEHQVYTFTGVSTKPVLSLLRHFSAPVKVDYAYTDADLTFLLANDSDSFNRWEAGQNLMLKALDTMAAQSAQGVAMQVMPELLDALRVVLTSPKLDPAFVAQIVCVPTLHGLLIDLPMHDLDDLHAAREQLIDSLANGLENELLAKYKDLHTSDPYAFEVKAMAARTLKNTCLAYLMRCDNKHVDIAEEQFTAADNMTDQVSALQALLHAPDEVAEKALSDFYEQWKKHPLVIDKWLTLQAVSSKPGALKRVQALLEHSAFDVTNPNRVRSLLGAFCGANMSGFHEGGEAAYGMLADYMMQIDAFNPQLAARLAEPFTRWKRMSAERQELMRAQLQRIADIGPSKELAEVVIKTLD